MLTSRHSMKSAYILFCIFDTIIWCVPHCARATNADADAAGHKAGLLVHRGHPAHHVASLRTLPLISILRIFVSHNCDLICIPYSGNGFSCVVCELVPIYVQFVRDHKYWHTRQIQNLKQFVSFLLARKNKNENSRF